MQHLLLPIFFCEACRPFLRSPNNRILKDLAKSNPHAQSTGIVLRYIEAGSRCRTKFLVNRVDIFLHRFRYVSFWYPLGFFFRGECLRVINAEDHAAHCGNDRTKIHMNVKDHAAYYRMVRTITLRYIYIRVRKTPP